MRKFSIQGTTGNSILGVGERLDNLKNYVPDTKTVIITDSNVLNYSNSTFLF